MHERMFSLACQLLGHCARENEKAKRLEGRTLVCELESGNLGLWGEWHLRETTTTEGAPLLRSLREWEPRTFLFLN